jgi:predicted dehydrogenase
MEQLRAAIIGVGHLGIYHAEKYHSLPDVNLTAIVDVDREHAERVAAKFGATAYTDYRDILDQVDLISIVTPTELHYQIAEDFLKSQVHILLEKPITQTVSQAQALIDLAESNGVILQVGHLERFNPALQVVKEQLQNPYFIESHRLAPFNGRATDVDVVLDLMIHDIDIILSMISSPLVSIQSVGVPVITDEIDIANARLEFADGCVANVTASRVSNKQMRKFRIFQPNTCISIDFGKHKTTVYSKRADEDSESTETSIDIDEHSFQDSDALLEEICAFVHSVRSGSAPIVSGRDGKQALEVALEITKLIKNSRSGDQDKKPLLQSINTADGVPV